MSSDMYQDFILELYKHPINFEKMDDADYHATSHNALCGDRLEIYIKADKGKIEKASYKGEGCAISQATMSLLTEELKGKTLEQAKTMKKEDILRIIQVDLSKNPSRMKCALLSLETLKKALTPG